MKFKELKNMKRIFHTEPDSTYRYAMFIPDKEFYTGEYYPIFANLNYIFDFTKTAKAYLKRKHITKDTLGDIFVYGNSKLTKLYDIDKISLEQAQEIIDRNTILFNKIQMKIKENELIDQINAV